MASGILDIGRGTYTILAQTAAEAIRLLGERAALDMLELLVDGNVDKLQVDNKRSVFEAELSAPPEDRSGWLRR